MLSTPRRRRRKQELQSLLKALKNPLAKFNSLGNKRKKTQCKNKICIQYVCTYVF